MSEGERFPGNFDARQPPMPSLSSRVAVAFASPMESENDVVSFCFYLLNAPLFDEELKKLNDDEKLFLFDQITKTSSILFKKLEEPISYTKKEVFGVMSISDEIKEARECVKHLRQLEEHSLLDNYQIKVLDKLTKELGDVENDNE